MEDSGSHDSGDKEGLSLNYGVSRSSGAGKLQKEGRTGSTSFRDRAGQQENDDNNDVLDVYADEINHDSQLLEFARLVLMIQDLETNRESFLNPENIEPK